MSHFDNGNFVNFGAL